MRCCERMRRLLIMMGAILCAAVAGAQDIPALPDTVTLLEPEWIEPDTVDVLLDDEVELLTDSLTDDFFAETDSLISAVTDSLSSLPSDSVAIALADSVQVDTWAPDPSKATWLALAFPGAGQIYNRKYWKLPIVYGGFLGCAYALNWNNQMYSDYSQAYLDIMDDDPATASYEGFLPPTYDVAANEEYLKKVFKNRKDRYRRYRDLSIFSFIGVYLISVVDAYVDAELSHFDITEDLGLDLRPSLIENVSLTQQKQSFGLQCCITF